LSFQWSEPDCRDTLLRFEITAWITLQLRTPSSSKAVLTDDFALLGLGGQTGIKGAMDERTTHLAQSTRPSSIGGSLAHTPIKHARSLMVVVVLSLFESVRGGGVVSPPWVRRLTFRFDPSPSVWSPHKCLLFLHSDHSHPSSFA
jgi:hypothetical protein